MEGIKVFVSHARENGEASRHLAAVLDAIRSVPGLEPLVDQESIDLGEEWRRKIHRLIRASHGAVLVLSPAALESKWVQYEAGLIDHYRLLNDQQYCVAPLLIGVRAGAMRKHPGWSTFTFSDIQAVKLPETADAEAIRQPLVDCLRNWLTQGAEEILRQRSVYLGHLPAVADAGLYGRARELKWLSECWHDSRTKVAILEAPGGVGKSAIIRRWLADIRHGDGGDYFGAANAYGWSFYSQGTTDKNVSADAFLQHALRFFGDPDPSRGDSSARGSRLFELVRKQPNLFILDGLEPLQYPPGAMAGSLKDTGLRTLLTELAQDPGPGLCVITTRERPTDLDGLAGVQRRKLPPLSMPAGRQLLLRAGVTKKATREELDEVVTRYGGHSLALFLYGRFVRDFHDGELRRLPLPSGGEGATRALGIAADDEEPLGSARQLMAHAKNVMFSYERMFERRGKPEAVELLYVMGLFDRPAESGAIDALRSRPAVAGLTEHLSELDHEGWTLLKENLRSSGLLLKANPWRPGDLDAHPLVREYFGDALRTKHPEAWKEGHRTLWNHLAETTEDQPDDPASMSRLYSAVNHACAAGEHGLAFEELIKRRAWRLDRPDEKEWWHSTRRLGLVGDDLVALSQLFDRRWTRLAPTLAEGQAIEILSNTGVRMRSLGRLDETEAFTCFGAAHHRSLALLEDRSTLSDERRERVFDGVYAACQLCELRLIQGKLGEARRIGDEAVRLAEICRELGHPRHPYIRMHARSSLADVHFQLGNQAQAEELFRAAREIDVHEGPRPPFLHSQSCYRHGMLEIEGGRCEALLELIRSTPAWGEDREGKSLLAQAIELLIHGWALLEQDADRGVSQQPETGEILANAAGRFKASGYSDYSSRGLVIQARYRRLRGIADDWERAEIDLDEAQRETRGIMALLVVDVLIERIHLALAKGDRGRARKVLREAREGAKALGYGRALAKLDVAGRGIDGA